MSIMLICYNRGCGQNFDPNNNNEDSCRHHPGVPFFHDAYKGWSCCNKKCTDFTEFLNIKGCTLSKHSNVKPPEPAKREVDRATAHEVIEVKIPSPIVKSTVVRPPFESPLTTIVPNISAALQQFTNTAQTAKKISEDSQGIVIGTSCKNSGCNVSYDGPEADKTECIHHPGCPVFHEGLKFWSCCQKKTTDFSTFLSQVGCASGVHKWTKEVESKGTVKCRWDWHQTPDYVIVTVYSKQYDPIKSFVKLNGIRLHTKIVFPLQADASFDLDVELTHIISVEKSSVQMTPSKVEIKMKKFEIGAWKNLEIPKSKQKDADQAKEVQEEKEETPDDDLVDLSDVDSVYPLEKMNLTEVTE